MSQNNVVSETWCQEEDKILKAAVLKYGKKEWNQIATELHSRSVKQYRARCYEWIDKNKQKKIWNCETDIKFVYASQLLPTQWKTFSPKKGRTPEQCLKRYKYLVNRDQFNNCKSLNLNKTDVPNIEGKSNIFEDEGNIYNEQIEECTKKEQTNEKD